MSTTGGDEDLPKEQLERLREYSEEITENFDKIEFVFEDIFISDRVENNFDDYFSTMNIMLYDVVEEEEELDVASDIVNIIANFRPELYDWLRERNPDFANKMKNLSMTYGLPIQRRLNHVQQGHSYWSNVKSDLGVRSNLPAFSHELVIDHEEVVEIDSSVNGTAILSHHFLQQVAKSPDVLGDDIHTFINPDIIEEINQISQDLLDELEKYEFDEIDEASVVEDEEEQANDGLSDRE